MRLARLIFLLAGLYGVAVLIPGFFAERVVQPPILHPEFYYGFLGSALVWQTLFLLVAIDPARFRSVMFIAALEKAAFFIPSMVLYATGRLGLTGPFFGALIDGVWMQLFLVAWWSARPAAAAKP